MSDTPEEIRVSARETRADAIWSSFEKFRLSWDTFTVRYRTQSLARPLDHQERAWRTDAQIFLTSSDPSIGIPEVSTDGGRALR